MSDSIIVLFLLITVPLCVLALELMRSRKLMQRNNDLLQQFVQKAR